ncbi:sugar ABC transporter substrate-binding protein, partial [Rhizobium ruizarguesonis]
EGAPGDTFLATYSVASAKAVCDYILKEAGGKWKMVIIHGQNGTTPEVDRSKGCAESLKAYPDEGFQIMQNMLQANPDVRELFGDNLDVR